MSRPLGIEDDDSKESVEEYKNRLQRGEMNKWVDEDTLYDICGDLVTAGYDYRFAEATKLAALQFEGVYDLLLMWAVEKNPRERRKITADILELLHDIRRGYEIQASKKEQEAEKSNTSQQTDK